MDSHFTANRPTSPSLQSLPMSGTWGQHIDPRNPMHPPWLALPVPGAGCRPFTVDFYSALPPCDS